MSTSLRAVPRPRAYGLSGAAERAVLRALRGIRIGELTLELPGGELHRFGDATTGPSARVIVERRDLFRRLARSWRMGLGESYAAGDWHADDLPALCRLLVLNAEDARTRPPFERLWRLQRYRPRVPARNGVRRARRHVAYHYDLGNDLYRLFLDESLTYSCAYFERPGESLAQAQQNKLRRICEKLALGPDDHVLEIGCGWGSFALVAAGQFGARVTGVTVSREQYSLARRRVEAAGLAGRVEIVDRDYRLLEGSYTKIASIEMLEAIGYDQFETFFRTCDRLLAPGGLVCVQTIAIPDQRFERYRRSEDWIQRYVFPGSLLPSLTAIARALTGASALQVYSLEEIGVHYAATLRAWRERFLANAAEVRRLGYDERFQRIWEFYLAYSEAAFETRSLRDVQLVLTRSFNDRLPAYPSPRVTF